MVAAAIGAATLAAGVYSSNKQGKAAEEAAKTQAGAADAGVGVQREQLAQQQAQFQQIQELLKPYVTAGTGALTQQGNLVGTNGADAQRQAIAQLQASPQFQSLLSQGNNNILANASATGGLRGGNVQGALAQFAPQLLAQTINDQYTRLGGLTSTGLGAATQTGAVAGQFGALGQNSSNNIVSLLQQRGSANAGGLLAGGAQQAGYANAITGALGAYGGLGGFRSTPSSTGGTSMYAGGGWGTGNGYGNQDLGGYF